MPLSDFHLVFQWWGTLFLVGASAYPLTHSLFHEWFDEGYAVTKAVGLATVTFLVYLGAMVHIVPFTQGTVWGAMAFVFAFGLSLQWKAKQVRKTEDRKRMMAVFFAEEAFFFVTLLFWSWVKAHEPSIHNLEKFMDFGFTKSILNSRYFPPPDMWYAGFPINYYYFGHTVMAVITRLSGIDLTYTFNLMLATLFAFTSTMSFNIGVQLLRLKRKFAVWQQVIGGVLTAFLVTLAGNMQTIYAFTKGYDGDNVQPFWQLLWPITTFWQNLPQGLNRYWYANATRFIPYTIHEFPSYSFVVSDVHGHVLSLPFVLLALTLLVLYFGFTRKEHHPRWEYTFLVFYGFLCGVLLMTNATDGPIYFGLFVVLLAVRDYVFPMHRRRWQESGKRIGVAFVGAVVAAVPFVSHFKSFVNGIAVNCPPASLANTRIGPILFEGVEKCQHSPLWMMWLLWGFFIYCGAWLLALFVRRLKRDGKRFSLAGLELHEVMLALWFIISVLLIIFPEFFYFKDIYPMHFRSNTMFKLGYQAFIMFSIVSGYTIMTMRRETRNAFVRAVFYVLLIPQLFLIAIYPIFSIRSYFDSLRHYEGIFGMSWQEIEYPSDWAGIVWLNQYAACKTTNPKCVTPVIVEADGDSYTDYDRVSAFTGLPTVVGWPVHEWLWRGTYDVVAPRRTDVEQIYESQDVNRTKELLAKYHVSYIFVGMLERQKFPALAEEKFLKIGTVAYTSGGTTIYRVMP